MNIILHASDCIEFSVAITDMTFPPPGLVMAAELSSTVEPLTHVFTIPVHEFIDFLKQIKTYEDSHTQYAYTPEPTLPIT